MNTKLLRNLGIASAVVIVIIFGIGLVEQQEQKVESLEIDAWIECRNSPDSFIQESYPATCVSGDDRVKQPIISSDESQWEQCISRDDVNIVDNGEKADKCITPDDVVFMEPLTFDSENKLEIKSAECFGDALCSSGKVTEIIDGDTVKVDGKSIRLALVDAPELKYDGGQAKQFVEQVCPVGSQVIVDQDDDQLEDKYGRMLGVVYCNGVNLNQEILDSGIGDLYEAFCDQSEFATHTWATKHGCGS